MFIGFKSTHHKGDDGQAHSVLSHMTAQIVRLVCMSHFASQCLVAAVKVLPLEVDDYGESFYYFDMSAKRKR